MTITEEKFDQAVNLAVSEASRVSADMEQNAMRAMAFSNVAIAHGLKLIADAINDLDVDVDGMTDGLKQLAVEVGGIGVTLAR